MVAYLLSQNSRQHSAILRTKNYSNRNDARSVEYHLASAFSP